MQRGEAWQPVAAIVAQRYRVRSLDFATWTFEERVAEIASATVPGDVLVGYSMGGRLALHAALRDPKRLAALVLVGVTAGIEDPVEREDRRRSDESLAEWMERRSIEEVVARWEANPVFATQSAALRDRQRPGRLSHDPQLLAQLLKSAGQGATPPRARPQRGEGRGRGPPPAVGGPPRRPPLPRPPRGGRAGPPLRDGGAPDGREDPRRARAARGGRRPRSAARGAGLVCEPPTR